MLVPLKLRYGRYEVGTEPPSRYGDLLTWNALAGSRSDSMPAPGATMSGFAALSTAAGPRELNVAIVSSPRATLPKCDDAPIVSTQGPFPGAVTPPVVGAAFRAATVVAGGGDDDDAGRGNALGSQRERIEGVRLVDAGGQ